MSILKKLKKDIDKFMLANRRELEGANEIVIKLYRNATFPKNTKEKAEFYQSVESIEIKTKAIITDKERIKKLKKDITTLLLEFDEETEGFYEINHIDVIKTETEMDHSEDCRYGISGVDLNIQV